MNLKKIAICDIETYENYFLIKFKKLNEDKYISFILDECNEIDLQKLSSVLRRNTIITFNGINYDKLMIQAAYKKYNNSKLKSLSDFIIKSSSMWWQVEKKFNLPNINFDHIDLMNVAPSKASLKIYAGRLKCKELQDLPFPPDKKLLTKEKLEVSSYCSKDLRNTESLFLFLKEDIELREQLGKENILDLRSKSDAQVSEAVIKNQLIKIHGFPPHRLKPPSPKNSYNYVWCDNIKFKTNELIELQNKLKNTKFILTESGHFGLPEELKNYYVKIDNQKYKIGVGGLHSTEKKIAHYADSEIRLRDYDVKSYYPFIIINNKLYPKHIGKSFLRILKELLDKRLKFKKLYLNKKLLAKEAVYYKTLSDALKITVNSAFGKLGNKYSFLYSPELVVQVTITGQLSLLMLIEKLSINDIETISGNTDGVVLKYEKHKQPVVDKIIKEWESITKYDLEYTDYELIASRDVNNYVAVTKDKEIKSKGFYCNTDDKYNRLRNNPNLLICNLAIYNYLSHDISIEQTIKDEIFIENFLTLRTVNGGAIKDTEEIGKAIRWYYSNSELDAIYTVKNGNKVPKSDFAVPLQNLTSTIPDDLDYDFYINESIKRLADMGVNY